MKFQEQEKRRRTTQLLKTISSTRPLVLSIRKPTFKLPEKAGEEKTESPNLDKDGNKLWKLAKAMNNEDTRSAPICIQQGEERMTGKKAANCLAAHSEQVGNVTIPPDPKKEVREGMKQTYLHAATKEYMNKSFNIRELENALRILSKRKLPGPDKLTNEMLQHLSMNAKKTHLNIFNKSWQTGTVPKC